MAKNLGVTFSIGASLGSTVASAFASVQNKLKATQAAFADANRKAKSLDGVIAARNRLDALSAKMRAEGAAKADLANLEKLAQAYAKAARNAGVYGKSLEQIRHMRLMAQTAMASNERSLSALSTVQRGRDIRSEQTQARKTAISNAFADLAPLAGLASPIRTGMEFDAAMSKVRAISGAVGEDFDALRDQARQLGASTTWSAKEAAEGMTFLAMAGFKTNEVMAAMPGMLALASAGGMELGDTADIASNILTGFKFKAGQMTHVGDILAKAFTSSNTTIASLGEAFSYCAPVAANAGQAFESVTAMIGKLGDAGIAGSMAGTGLNAIIGRLAKPPKEAADALKKLGVSIANAKGEMRPMEDVFADVEKKMARFSEQERIALAKALYGAEHFAKGMVLQTAAIDGSLYSLRDSLKEVDGYADKVAAIQNDNLAGDFKQLNSAMQGAAICLTDVVTPPLRQLMGQITPMVAGLGQWISANPRLAQGLMLVAGAFVGLKVAGLAFTLLNSYRKSFVGGLVSLQGQAMRPIAGIRNAFAGLRVELARPVGISLSGASQRAAMFKNRLDSLRQSFAMTASRMRQFNAESVKAGIASVFAGTKAAASGALAATGRAGWNMLRLGIRGVGMAFRTVFGPMNLLIMGLSFGVDYIIGHWDKIAPYFQALWDNVKAIFSSVVDWLKPIFDAISGLFDPFLAKIKSFGGMIGGMLEKIGKAWDWLAGNDKEKERKQKEAALLNERKQKQEEIAANLPKEAQAQFRAQMQAEEPKRKSVWSAETPAEPPARTIAVNTPARIAVPTVMQAQERTKTAPEAKPAGKPKMQPAQPETPAANPPKPQIIQPQVQVAVNVTQNGIPDQTFATGVMNAIRSRQAELEQMISAIVNEQARLAYG